MQQLMSTTNFTACALVSRLVAAAGIGMTTTGVLPPDRKRQPAPTPCSAPSAATAPAARCASVLPLGEVGAPAPWPPRFGRWDAQAYAYRSQLSSSATGRVYVATRTQGVAAGAGAGVGGVGSRDDPSAALVGELVVVKEYFKRCHTTDEAKRAILREVACMRRVARRGVANTVRLIDAAEDPATWYLVCRYEPNRDLWQHLHEYGSVGWQERDAVRAVLGPLLEALRGIHQLGIVHRDLKPENILLVPRDKEAVAQDAVAACPPCVTSRRGRPGSGSSEGIRRLPRIDSGNKLAAMLALCSDNLASQPAPALSKPGAAMERHSCDCLPSQVSAGLSSPVPQLKERVPRRSTVSNHPARRFLCAVLADFGMAVDTTISEASGRAGTVVYMPPETASADGAPYPCPAAVDIWAVGILAFELLTGITPFDSNVEARTMFAIAYDNPFADEPRRARIKPGSHAEDFIRLALAKDPLQRPSAAQLLHHPFVTRHWVAGHAVCLGEN